MAEHMEAKSSKLEQVNLGIEKQRGIYRVHSRNQIKMGDRFNCPCGFGEELRSEDTITVHIMRCESFQRESPLFQFVGRLRLEQLSRDQLVTLKADLTFQLSRVVQALFATEKQRAYGPEIQRDEWRHNENKNTQKANEKEMQREEQRQNENKNHQDMQREQVREHENKNPQRTYEQQMQTEDWRQQEKLFCESCRKVFFSGDERIFYLQECLHMICRPCLKRQVASQFLEKKGKLLCCEIGCAARISHEEMEELELRVVMSTQSIVECVKCKGQFGFEQGSEGELVKDAKGNTLSGVQLQHYIRNRFTCQSCGTEQCRECHATPYHTNQTCEEVKQNKTRKKCRLCEQPCDADQKAPEHIREVCLAQDCQKRKEQLCRKKLACGHFCNGVKGEARCLACLQCVTKNEDDYCNICFTEALKSAPCVASKCGHIFHQECVEKRVLAKWSGPRVVYGYCLCPLCKQWLKLEHPGLQTELDKAEGALRALSKQAVERLSLEGKTNDDALRDPRNQFFRDPTAYALDIFCFYECFKCKQPYFGGLKNCQANNDRREFKKEDLVCPGCCPISFEHKCKKHGTQYIEFKCRFCCSPAVWFCGGTTHYCEPCHNGSNQAKMNKPCPGPHQCPLGIEHKPTGQECALGCALCRFERMGDKMK